MKNVMNTMKLMFVMFLISAMIVGCGKSEGEKDKSETSGKENNPSSTTKKQSIDFFEEKEVPEPEKVTQLLSPGEIIKRFYLAVNEKDYSAAKKYLSPELLTLLKSRALAMNQGLEKILDIIATSGNLSGIEIKQEGEIPEKYWGRIFGGEIEIDSGAKLYYVEYVLNFKPPLDRIKTGWRERRDYVIERDGIGKILGLKTNLDERYEGISSILKGSLNIRFFEYNIINVSQLPSGREGWTNYTFTIRIRNVSSELVPIKLANLYAVADGHKFEGRSFISEKLKEPTFGIDRKSGKLVKVFTRMESTDVLENSFLPQGYSVIYENSIEVPTLAPQIDFYLVTPDLRCLTISTQGAFSPLAGFPSQTKDELALGDTFVVKDYLEITLLGLDLTKKYSTSKKADEFRLWIRMKNLALGDIPISNEVLYFQFYSEDGYTGSARIESVTIPPLFEKIRPLDPYLEIEHGKNYALLVGVVGPKRISTGGGISISASRGGKEESKSFLAYRVYRFKAQPTSDIASYKVTIEEVKGKWHKGYGNSYFLDGITLRVKNNGDWPVYIEKVKARSYVERDVRVEKWLESHEEITITVMAPQSGAGGSIEIEVLDSVGEVLAFCSWEANPTPATSESSELIRGLGGSHIVGKYILEELDSGGNIIGKEPGVMTFQKDGIIVGSYSGRWEIEANQINFFEENKKVASGQLSGESITNWQVRDVPAWQAKKIVKTETAIIIKKDLTSIWSDYFSPVNKSFSLKLKEDGTFSMSGLLEEKWKIENGLVQIYKGEKKIDFSDGKVEGNNIMFKLEDGLFRLKRLN